MRILLSLAVIIGLISVPTGTAEAACESGDYICEKFARIKSKQTHKRAVPRKKTVRRVRRKRQSTPTRRARLPVAPKTVTISPAPIRTSMNQEILAAPPAASYDRLPAGAIGTPPKEMPKLIFGSAERLELAAAKCAPTERSARRVTCQIAVHRVALISDTGSGCMGTLDLRELEFAKNDEGAWLNEDSISLCSGRLLRRTELVPVSVNGSPRYAVSEHFQLIGGDKACAAPYLRTRQPLKKTYMPTGKNGPKRLQCGIVSSR